MRGFFLVTAALATAAAGLAAVPPVVAETESQGSWVDVGPMPNRRANAVAVRMRDGRVLVAGGETALDGRCKSNADIFNPTTNTWVQVAGMHRDRCGASATLLPNGQVLVVGGVGLLASGLTRIWRTAELYRPKQDRWTRTAPLPEPRLHPVVEVIARHRVLVTGGESFSERFTSSYVYLVPRDRWIRTASMKVSRVDGSSVRLRGGNILVAGGPKNKDGLRTAQRYVVNHRTWRPAGHFSGTSYPILFRTRSGHVQAIPNSTRWSQREVHRFDPAANDWSRGSLLPVPRADPQVVALRANAFVLGGWGPSTNYTTRSALLWRPALKEWVRWTRIPQPVTGHSAVRLRDGSVLVLGGQTIITEGTHVPRKLAYRYYP